MRLAPKFNRLRSAPIQTSLAGEDRKFMDWRYV